MCTSHCSALFRFWTRIESAFLDNIISFLPTRMRILYWGRFSISSLNQWRLNQFILFVSRSIIRTYCNTDVFFLFPCFLAGLVSTKVNNFSAWKANRIIKESTCIVLSAANWKNKRSVSFVGLAGLLWGNLWKLKAKEINYPTVIGVTLQLQNTSDIFFN